MLSRALSLATVTLLIGCLAAIPVRAQNLEAGKSPAQIFAGTCTACHKAPRGLLKTVPAGSLPGFLRQHYTTSSEMASLLSAFLISNGAADTRYVGTRPTQQPKDAQPAVPEQLDRFGRPIRPRGARPEAAPQQAARPDADGLAPQAEPGRPGRNAKRLARPSEATDAAKPAAEGQPPAQAATEPVIDGRKAGSKQKLGKRGKPSGEEPPKVDAAKPDAAKPDVAKPNVAKPDAVKEESAKGEPAKDDAAKGEAAKEEVGKPSGDSKSEPAKIDAPKEPPKQAGSETPVLRADPVPPVTPAPAAAAPTTASSGAQDPPASAPAQSASPPAQSAPPAVTAAVPPPPPAAAPAGPPVPPISQ